MIYLMCFLLLYWWRKQARVVQILMQFLFCSFLGLETWSNLTKLEILDLSRNSLDGSIIYDLASVPSLRKLDLSSNHINNSLPNINGNKIQLIYDLFNMLPSLIDQERFVHIYMYIYSWYFVLNDKLSQILS